MAVNPNLNPSLQPRLQPMVLPLVETVEDVDVVLVVDVAVVVRTQDAPRQRLLKSSMLRWLTILMPLLLMVVLMLLRLPMVLLCLLLMEEKILAWTRFLYVLCVFEPLFSANTNLSK